MIRRWFQSHRSLLLSALSGSLVTAVVVTTAVVSGGYQAQRLDLGDGSVWVPNSSQQVIGRASTEVLALDTVVHATGTELDVLQNGATVLLLDRSENKIGIVDPATAEVVEFVPLPPAGRRPYLAGDNVVLHSTLTGELWMVPVARLSEFDPTSEPTATFGAGSVVSPAPDGTVLVYSVGTQQVTRLDTSGDVVEQSVPVDFDPADDDFALTSVAGTWVLLNRSSGQVSIEGRMADLRAYVPVPSSAEIQRAGVATDRVLIAHSAGLVAVDLSDGTASTVTEAGGAAAPPVVLGECEYAAWSDGKLWRRCDGRVTELSLADVPPATTDLRFAINGDRIVLNDRASGGTWAVQQNGESIDNWSDLLDEAQPLRAIPETAEEAQPEPENDPVPPVAVDDQLGARPGRATLLPVLLNDFDANGDVLVVRDFDQIDERIGRIEAVLDGQQVQLRLEESASGTFAFGYTVDDGRGGSAVGKVTIEVRTPDENDAPSQVRPSRASVAEGGEVTAPVLGDWIDPDGDAFHLASATAEAPDVVRHRPDGAVVFRHGGEGQARSIALSVSDGRAAGAGSVTVSIRSSGDVPLVAEPFVVHTSAGDEVTIRPLTHVRGGSGDIRLSSVPAKPGSTIEASPEAGTFSFVSDEVRTHHLEYVANDSEQTVVGTVRVEVEAPPPVNSAPITIAKTAFVRALGSEIVDVASTDVDPAGGVLMVTDVENVPTDSGIRADVLDQSSVRVTLTAPLEGAVTFDYRVSNGLADALGTITVIEVPPPSRLQPPDAADDTVSVRTGGVIDIPVLRNDEHPDGEELTLESDLVTGVARASGLLFTSGDNLRYLAPETPGNFTAVYQVTAPDGQVDQAQVTIAVREIVEASNTPPVLPPVTVRVAAGETVRIPIPLTGSDPEGDSVQLLGQDTTPEKGAVTDVGTDYFDYAAGGYSAGTDSFTYSVVDPFGARASGLVRIGISPRSGAGDGPVAVSDEVRIRPGKTVSVPVLDNDIDPGNSDLRVLGIEPNSEGVRARVVGNVVEVTPPAGTGRYGVVYTIENAQGARSSAFLTVIVDPETPPSYPIVRDTVLTLADIVGREVVTVDVLRNVFFADGAESTLAVGVLAGFDDTARVTPDKSIAVTIGEERQVVPFSVAHPDDPDIVAFGFLWVPGFEDALPQLDRTADALTVTSGSTLTIDINDHVISLGDRGVRLIDPTSIQATHANGEALIVDSDTLRYTSADNYFGPASISFQVTDGTSAEDPNGRKATLVLPITVTPKENQPPVFLGGVIDVEPGEVRTIDLLRLTTYPSEDGDQLRFTVLGTPPQGFEYTITGTSLEIAADESARPGTASALTLGVRDDSSEGKSGRIDVNVVRSTRPLAVPAPDDVSVRRGSTTTVDVLANDEATNPFPGRPLRVVSIRGLNGSALPDGVGITASADSGTLTVQVAGSALPADTNLQYEVSDATGDPDRNVFGSVRISVQDRPDAPPAPAHAEGAFQEGLVTLRLTAPSSNNSPVTGYEVVSSSNGGYRRDCGTSLLCQLPDLTPGLLYQFSVIATNAVGLSDESPLSVPVSADYLPAAPETVEAHATGSNPAGAALAISWSRVPDPERGSAVGGYGIRVTGPDVDFSQTLGASETFLETTAGGALRPNAQYVVTVHAENGALVASADDWREASSPPVTTIGPPGPVEGGVTAALTGRDGTVTVTWGASDPNGGAGVTYSIGRFEAGATIPESCSIDVDKAGTDAGQPAPASSGWVDTATSDGASYRYVVYAENEFFCTVNASGEVESKLPPGAAVADTRVVANGTSGQFDLQVGELSVLSGTADHFEAELNGSGVWFPVTADQWLTTAQDLTVYGHPQAVAYRGCRDAGSDLCGPASAPDVRTPVNTRAEIISCAVGAEVVVNPPVTASALDVAYSFDFDDGGADDFDGFFDDNPQAPAPGGEGPVRVRVKAIVAFEGTQYTDPGYDEDVCAP